MKRRRWLPRFRLRSMLVASTLLCLVLAIWSSLVNPYRLQAIAIDHIRQLGGKVETRPASGSEWHRWLVHKLVADDAFVEAYKVKLFAESIPDTAQSQIGHLPFVERLYVDTSGIDDRLIRSLAPGTHLQELSARDTQLTDRSMATLSSFPRLEVLRIGGTDVGDTGLMYLADSPALHRVAIRWTNVTRSGVDLFRRARPDCDVLYYPE